MWMRLFVILIIVLALSISILALLLSREQLLGLIQFRDFFDVALPILAFGALIKYLCKSMSKCSTCCKCAKN